MLSCLCFMNKACVKVMSMNLNVKYLCMSIEHETNKTGVKFPWQTNKTGVQFPLQTNKTGVQFPWQTHEVPTWVRFP